MATHMKPNDAHEVMMFNSEDGLLVSYPPESIQIVCGVDNGGDYSGDETCDHEGKVIRCPEGDFVRQPCKARGVTISSGQNPHVARFAYIDIPLGTVHGTVLSCCHPVCIASGRRFRYCTHCQTAVAKRNFNVRHAHGNLNSPPLPPSRPNKIPLDGGACQNVIKTDLPGTETAIPTVICVDDNSSVKTATDEGSSTMVSLSAHELEIVNLLRCRPGKDYPAKVEQWKQALLSLAQTARGSKSEPTPQMTTSGGESDFQTSCEDDDRDEVVSFCMEAFEGDDFASFFDR